MTTEYYQPPRPQRRCDVITKYRTLSLCTALLAGAFGAKTLGDVSFLAGLVVLACFTYDMWDIAHPQPYVVLKTGETKKEVRPLHSVVGHVLLFRWIRPLTGDGPLFQKLLVRLNRSVMTWDLSFKERNEDPAAWVLSFCKRWGIETERWVWEKRPEEFVTPNDFFARKYHPKYRPPVGTSLVVSPATSVVSWYDCAGRDLPRKLKNDEWTLDDVGIPNHQRYVRGPAAILYLAPQDYHRFHCPLQGVVEHVRLLDQDKYSVTVKPYIFKHVNILSRNRRAVVVIQGKDVRVAMIVVGGITVDSIRLESDIRTGATVRKGQPIGAFARGGSSVALLFDVLDEKRGEIRRVKEVMRAVARTPSCDVKVEVGQSLAGLVVRGE